MQRRPTIKSPCVADRYAISGERVAEVHSAKLGIGCLISAREMPDGTLRIEIYHTDPRVVVLAPTPVTAP